MKRSQYANAAFLVVEGASDKLIYGLIVDPECCKFEIAHGRDNAIKAIRILNAGGVEGVLAIVDADAAHITGDFFPESNLLQTELRDLECMLLASPAFDRVLDEYGTEAKVSAFAQKTPMIAQQLAMCASPLGCFRLISTQKDHQLRFKEMAYSNFVDKNTLDIDVSKMVREVINKSQKHGLDTEEIEAQIFCEEGKGHDCWKISSGHDIVAILSIAFRNVFSSKNAREVTPEILERSLRLAYEAKHLRSTKLYEEIVEWEGEDPVFPILNRATT